MEKVVSRPIGIVSKKTYLNSKEVMGKRCAARRADIPIYQKRAFDILSGICRSLGIKDIQSEKRIFCESVKRFYAIDIYIPDIRLAFEFDGKQHESAAAYDQERDDNILSDWGIVTVRYKNSEIGDSEFRAKIQKIITEQLKKRRNKQIVGFKRDLTRCTFNDSDFKDLADRETWVKYYRDFNSLGKNAKRKLLRYGQIPNHLQKLVGGRL